MLTNNTYFKIYIYAIHAVYYCDCHAIVQYIMPIYVCIYIHWHIYIERESEREYQYAHLIQNMWISKCQNRTVPAVLCPDQWTWQVSAMRHDTMPSPHVWLVSAWEYFWDASRTVGRLANMFVSFCFTVLLNLFLLYLHWLYKHHSWCKKSLLFLFLCPQLHLFILRALGCAVLQFHLRLTFNVNLQP